MSSQFKKEVVNLLNIEGEGSLTENLCSSLESALSVAKPAQFQNANVTSTTQLNEVQNGPHKPKVELQNKDAGHAAEGAIAAVVDPFAVTAANLELAKQQTAFLNVYNSNAAAQKQAMRNQQEQCDAYNANLARDVLSSQPIEPLETTKTVKMPFPLEVLPDEALDLINAVSSGSEARKEVFATGLFGAVSAATQGNWCIRDPSAFDQPLTFYSIIAAPSGFGKSTTCDVLAYPFGIHDSKCSLMDSGINAAKHKLALSAAQSAYKASVRKAVSKHGLSIVEAMAESQSLCNEMDELEKSVAGECKISRLLYRVTMEQLPFEMARRKGGAAILDPEGGLLTMITDSKSDIILKSFDDESFESVTRTAGKVRIQHPFLSITSFVQPSKLEAFCSKEKLADRGVHPRFCMMMARPENLRKDIPMPALNDGHMAWYADLIEWLLSIERNGDIAPQNVIKLSKAAEQRLHSGIRELLRDRENSDGALGAFESRLQQHTKNIAGLLFLMRRGGSYLLQDESSTLEVDADLIGDANKVMAFFYEHARVILSPEFSEGLGFANKILWWIKRHNFVAFSERDAQRGIGHCKVAQIRRGLSELERCNYVRRFVNSKKISTYVVHPHANHI